MDQDHIHFYEPSNGHGLRYNPFNAIIAPRPIGWISTRDAQGRVNLAPYSFFTAYLYDPPLIGFSSISWKDSVRNAQETGEFVWNLVTKELDDRMNKTAAPEPQGVDEFQTAGLTPIASRLVSVPRVGESRASMECKVTQIIQLEGRDAKSTEGWLVLGEVVGVHIDKSLIEDGVYQTARAHPILRAGRGGDYFEVTPDRMFEMERPPGSSSPAFHGK